MPSGGQGSIKNGSFEVIPTPSALISEATELLRQKAEAGLLLPFGAQPSGWPITSTTSEGPYSISVSIADMGMAEISAHASTLLLEGSGNLLNWCFIVRCSTGPSTGGSCRATTSTSA